MLSMMVLKYKKASTIEHEETTGFFTLHFSHGRNRSD